MKKIMIALALFALANVASAQQSQNQGTNSDSVSIATSTSQGGSVAGVTASNGLTVGCLVNCASTDQGSKDLAAAQIKVAETNAAAAKDIAALNAATAKEIAGRDQVIKNTPSVNGPSLTTSNDTCMGSTSGSVNIAGLGIGGGTSWVDGNCKMLKNSRELWNMGMKAAALALMCTDTANRDALEVTGFECPQSSRDRKRNQASTTAPSITTAQPAVAATYTGDDPLVRARLGMTSDLASK